MARRVACAARRSFKTQGLRAEAQGPYSAAFAAPPRPGDAMNSAAFAASKPSTKRGTRTVTKRSAK